MNLKENWTSNKIPIAVGVFIILIVGALSSYFVYEEVFDDEDDEMTWTEFFNIENRNFSSIGRNEYFILEPGYQLTLEGEEDDESVKLVITILNETIMVGNVETRVLEEREWVNGELVEVSRNYFAICNDTKAIFYFGEAVDDYEGGVVVSHEGEWRADEGNNKAGIMMPALPLVGSRYYQEIAPGIAMDRAEIISNDLTLETPAGTFEHCVKMEETTPIEPDEKEYKVHAPGIGLIQDEFLLLTSYGFTG
ncbi:MAG: hypothetical protein ACFFDT_29460 [Candidatus Hodarchaeota archaeon]